MNHTPEQQWSALSALYEEADGLPEHALPAFLERLQAAGHPLLPQLKRMLDARDHLDTDDFLGTLPKLSPPVAGSTTDWSAGRRVGPYRLVRPLGEGGMAEVWLAERDDGALKRQVAIKLPYPRPGRETFALRFDRERDILASLRHPHIAGLYDAGVTPQGQAWLALEYVEGQPISLFCDERGLPVRERVMLFRQVLLAVQHAHANLVIHRDLKPANILVTPQGEVRLLDFGIAKLLEAEGNAIEETELTRQAGRSLTPRYASPEQLMGLPLTTACDVYSLGVVFYELLSGERPYELKTESPAQLEHAILEVEPRAPSRRSLREDAAQVRGTSVKGLRRLLSPELDAIALRCLSKKAGHRYQSVDALVADVDRWLAGEAVLARAPGAWYRFAKFANRHRWGVGLGVASVLSLAAIATVAVVLGLEARRESARALAARDFMLDLFKRADHEKSRGADITARELLDTGRRDALKRLSAQPLLQVQLLEGIAAIQLEMGEYVNADSTFADVARIYAELGMPRETSLAIAAHADNTLRAGNLKRAQELLQQARDVPMRPLDDAELNARLTEIEGWIANLRVEADRARALFQESRAHAVRAFGPHHLKTLNALRGLIHAERQLRNHDAALALQGQLEAAARRTPGLEPKEFAAMDEERAELLYAAGRYSEGLRHVDAALTECRRTIGANDEWCRRLLLARMRLTLRVGYVDQAREDAAATRALADDRSSPTQQIDAWLLLLRLEAMSKPSPALEELLDRVRGFGTSGPEVPMNPVLKMRALLTVAEARLMHRDPARAREDIERVLARQGGNDGPSAPSLLLAVARTLRGVVSLQQAQPGEALQWFERSRSDLAAAMGPDHAMTRLFDLNRAVALEALGRHAQALQIVEASEPVLRQAMGPGSPTYLRLQAMKVRLQQASQAVEGGTKSKAPVPIGPSKQDAAAIDFFT
jgi:serine/threonine protein kinase